jgi:hypothetical protein
MFETDYGAYTNHRKRESFITTRKIPGAICDLPVCTRKVGISEVLDGRVNYIDGLS